MGELAKRFRQGSSSAIPDSVITDETRTYAVSGTEMGIEGYWRYGFVIKRLNGEATGTLLGIDSYRNNYRVFAKIDWINQTVTWLLAKDNNGNTTSTSNPLAVFSTSDSGEVTSCFANTTSSSAEDGERLLGIYIAD